MNKPTVESNFRLVQFSKKRTPTSDMVYIITEVGEFIISKIQPYSDKGALLIAPLNSNGSTNPNIYGTTNFPYYETNKDVWLHWFSYFYLNTEDPQDIPERLAAYYQSII